MAEMAGMAGMAEMAGTAGPIGIIERFKTGGVNSISSQWVGQTKMYLGLSHFWGVLTLLRTSFETNFVEAAMELDAPIRERAGPREVVRMS